MKKYNETTGMVIQMLKNYWEIDNTKITDKITEITEIVFKKLYKKSEK